MLVLVIALVGHQPQTVILIFGALTFLSRKVDITLPLSSSLNDWFLPILSFCSVSQPANKYLLNTNL